MMDRPDGEQGPRVEVFVDINCPFCFCQVQRVTRLGLTEAVTWRGIEHEPSLPTPAAPDHPLAGSIQAELRQLMLREPDFAVLDPGIRPNTKMATGWLQAVGRLHPQRHWEVIDAVAVALWRQGRDISDPGVLDDVARGLSLGPVTVTDEDRAQAQAHTDAWRTGAFEGRLPSARSPHGAVLLGLNEERRFRLFVESGLFSGRGGASC